MIHTAKAIHSSLEYWNLSCGAGGEGVGVCASGEPVAEGIARRVHRRAKGVDDWGV